MSPLARYLPLVSVLLFLTIGVLLRAWIHRVRHGHWGVILFREGPWVQHVRDAIFVLLLAAATLQPAWLALSPESFLTFSGLGKLPAAGWMMVGGLMTLAGIVFMFTAQLHLGNSWRIGIEQGASPGLIVGGLYQFCRNPIFVGMFIILAGLAVLIPTWLSVSVLVITIAGVRVQVLDEESYLLQAYGLSYRDYARQVGRFLPGLGRLG